jgi:CBS domain containing-hemolysin-like protein
MVTALGWLAVVGLIVGNALFVAAEFSLTSVDRTKLKRLADTGDRRAARVLATTRELSFNLSGAQLGITLCSLLLGFVAEPVIADALHPAFAAVGLPSSNAAPLVTALVLATLAQMLFGELVPQNLAISRPMPTALAITPFQRGFSGLFRPVIALFNGTANAIVRLTGQEPQEELRAARTPEELESLIGTSAREGTLPYEVAALLRRTLSFGDLTAGDLMTPRLQMVSLDQRETAADLLTAARESGHSRFPVHRGDVDEIVGAVHVKHAFAVAPGRRDRTPLSHLMDEPVRLPESLHGDDLLTALRSRGLQLAIVIDEYGGTAGLVTVEDLVEELVGQVRDEHDRFEELDAILLSNGSWSVTGRLRCDELPRRLGFTPPEGPYDTVAGLVLRYLGEIPSVGDTVTVDGWRIAVTHMDRRRIDRVEISPPGGEDA